MGTAADEDSLPILLDQQVLLVEEVVRLHPLALSHKEPGVGGGGILPTCDAGKQRQPVSKLCEVIHKDHAAAALQLLIQPDVNRHLHAFGIIMAEGTAI